MSIGSLRAQDLSKQYLQSIWSGWETLDAKHQRQFYAQGPHVFFDESPLKYDSWDQFEQGVDKILKQIKTAKFSLRDAQIHPAGPYAWVTGLIDQDALLTNGKSDKAVLRWTAVLQKQNGKWLILHEHVSRPTE